MVMIMKKYTIVRSKKQQQGLALIATLLVVAIFTFIGMNIATKGKKNQEMTGANVRNNVVFEASEITLRHAMQFINAIKNGEPQAGVPTAFTTEVEKEKKGEGETNKNKEIVKKAVENFKVENAIANSVSFVTNPEYTFIWDVGKLVSKVCKNNDDCDKNIKFVEQIDDEKLWKEAIKSTFKDADFKENYLSHVETYTLIELLRDSSVNADTYSVDGNFTGGAGRAYYYLITVKGSGFPPGTSIKNKTDPTYARENVILQAVYAQQY